MPTAKLGHSNIKFQASFPDKIKSKTLNREQISVERTIFENSQKPFCKKIFCGAFFQSAVPTAKLGLCYIKFQAANPERNIILCVMLPKPPSRGRGTALAVEGVFLGIDLLNFILHAYSSTRLRREPPRGGSLSLNSTFQLQKHYKSVVGITPSA